MDTDFFTLVLSILSLPLAIAKLVFDSAMNFLVFDILQLGPYLPITLG